MLDYHTICGSPQPSMKMLRWLKLSDRSHSNIIANPTSGADGRGTDLSNKPPGAVNIRHAQKSVKLTLYFK